MRNANGIMAMARNTDIVPRRLLSDDHQLTLFDGNPVLGFHSLLYQTLTEQFDLSDHLDEVAE